MGTTLILTRMSGCLVQCATTLALLALLGCQPEVSSPPRPVAIAPARPAQLLAELDTASLQGLWTSLRRELGKSGRALPEQVSLVATQALGLSPVLSGRLLAEEPAAFALAQGTSGIEWVAGFKVNSGREWVAELATGSDARFRARSLGRIIHLDGPVRSELSLGVTGNQVLFGSSSTALDTLGAYAVRAREATGPVDRARFALAEGGAPLQGLFELWFSAVRSGVIADVPGRAEHLAGGAAELGLDALGELISDTLDEVGPGEVDMRFEAGHLDIEGRFQGQALASDVNICSALRGWPKGLRAAAAWDGVVSRELLLAAFQAISSSSAPPQVAYGITPEGPTVAGWVVEEKRASAALSFAAASSAEVVRVVRSWLGERAIPGQTCRQAVGLCGQLRSAALGPERPSELAWGWVDGRGYVTFGAAMPQFWEALATPRAPEESALSSPCGAEDRAQVWVDGFGQLVIAAHGLSRQVHGHLSLATIAPLLLPEVK